MVKRALIVLSGICVKPYGIETLIEKKEICDYLRSLYTISFIEPNYNKELDQQTIKKSMDINWDEVDYNQYLDSWTIQTQFNLKYLDPLRLDLNPFRKRKVIDAVTKRIKELQSQGYIVDCICHSQGCWVLSLCDVQVNNVIYTGSPIGFKSLIGRSFVRSSISFFPWSKPKMKCNQFFNIYSENDFVGYKPTVAEDKKWSFGSQFNLELSSGLSHDFGDYLDFLAQNETIKDRLLLYQD